MKRENSDSSPFSALSYKEQQDRWLEWRSQQLDFKEAPMTPPPAEVHRPAAPRPAAQPVRLPMMQEAAAQNRRRELDQVLARHNQALKQAGSFRPANRNI